MPLNLDKHYVSEIDLFLEELAKKFPEPSKSQQTEINKFKEIIKRMSHSGERSDETIQPFS